MKKEVLGKFITIIACLCLFVAAFAVIFINNNYVQSIKKLVRSTTTANISELTVVKSQYLDEKIEYELKALQLLAFNIGERNGIFSCSELIREYQKLHGATNMWVLDINGNSWSSIESDVLSKEKDRLFTPALKGETAMSDVFMGLLGKRQVLFQTPIIHNGQIVGGVYEAYSLEQLQNTYGSSTYNNSGYSYVLDKNGTIMLAPVRFSYLQIYSNFRDVLKDGKNSNKAINDFMMALQNCSKGSAVFDFEGQSQFLSFTPLQAKKGWYFVTVIPLNMVEEDGVAIVDIAMRMSAVIILTMVLIVAAVLFSIYLRNRSRRKYNMYIRRIYGAIAQNIDTVICIVDVKESLVEYTFENSQEILGIPPQKFLQPVSEQDSEFLHELKQILQRRPAEKAVWELYLFNDVTGKNMWLEITALPVNLQGIDKYIFAVTDVTADRQNRELLNTAVAEAKQANAAKSNFLSSMSHDIRTPMNAIVGMTKLAQIHIDNKFKVNDCLQKIDVSGKHLLNLINDILDMSKIESGSMVLSSEAFSLPRLVNGDLDILQTQCRSKSQQLLLETKNIVHEELLGDTLRLNQIFLNLISNASKFTPENGKIIFAVEELPQRTPGYAAYRFSVSDNGIGIAAEFLPNIFTPFERENNRSVGNIEGTGLGLAITKNIVEAMGGRIWVESTEGKGSIFTVELELQLQVERDISTCGKALQGIRILFVGSLNDEAKKLVAYMTDFGMLVKTVASEAAAIQELYSNDQYKLVIITDEVYSVAGSARSIREVCPSLKLGVFSDGSNSLLLDDDIAGKTVDDIFCKPVFKGVLCQKLLQMLVISDNIVSDKVSTSILDSRRFLLAEDNALNREIIVELFAMFGAQVETAVDGKEAVAAFESRPTGYYDAIFMDIQMPLMDGYEAAQKIRCSQKLQAGTVPIVAMSGNVFAEDVQAAKQAGMNAHIGKPVDIDAICKVLHELLK